MRNIGKFLKAGSTKFNSGYKTKTALYPDLSGGGF